jgi:hypothetical protein
VKPHASHAAISAVCVLSLHSSSTSTALSRQPTRRDATGFSLQLISSELLLCRCLFGVSTSTKRLESRRLVYLRPSPFDLVTPVHQHFFNYLCCQSPVGSNSVYPLSCVFRTKTIFLRISADRCQQPAAFCHAGHWAALEPRTSSFHGVSIYCACLFLVEPTMSNSLPASLYGLP